jgi:copper(I)-binding protein
MSIRTSLRPTVALLAVGVLGLAACGSSGGGAAGDARSGSVRITHAWARSTAASQTTGAVYLTVVNGTGRAVQITGVRVPASIAEGAQMHATVQNDEMSSMHEVGSVSVRAHGAFTFATGHDHIMLMGLVAPLRAHQTFPITLVRRDGATVGGTVAVRGV